MTDVLERIASLDRFYIQQQFTLVVNKYTVSTVDSSGGVGEPLLHVKQKRMKVREEIDLYADEDQRQKALQIKRRTVFELQGRTDVKLADGTIIGQLQKAFGKSLLRSTWEILDADGNLVATAQEQSVAVALLRRFGDFIPFAGWITNFLPFHFDIAIDGRVVGTYIRQITIRDSYVMDLSQDTERRIDRRVAAAFAIALDALQSR